MSIYKEDLEIISKVSNSLLKRRKELGLSRKKISLETKLSTSTIQRIELKLIRGEFLTFLRLCRALKIDLEDLLRSILKP